MKDTKIKTKTEAAQVYGIQEGIVNERRKSFTGTFVHVTPQKAARKANTLASPTSIADIVENPLNSAFQFDEIYPDNKSKDFGDGTAPTNTSENQAEQAFEMHDIYDHTKKTTEVLKNPGCFKSIISYFFSGKPLESAVKNPYVFSKSQ